MPAAPQPERVPDAEHPADAAALRRIRAGDTAAWREILTRHQDLLYATCVRVAGGTRKRDPGGPDPADLCQEAMVKIVQGLPTFDGQSRLSTWMTRIAINVCLSHLRATKVRKHASLDAPPPGSPPGSIDRSGSDWVATLADPGREPAGGSNVQPEDRAAFAAAWSRLDAEQRVILTLRDVRGLEYDQIAQVLDLQLGTVKSRLFRARQALRTLIDHAGQPDPTAGPFQ